VSTDAVATSQPGFFGRVVQFFREVRTELGKVTWPSREEVRKATTVIVIFVSALGLLIGLLDLVLQFILVRVVTGIF
jgi:preprotein translocase subunit SecE